MKKKVMMVGAGLTLGSALLVTSAFADIGKNKGYETYKEAIRTTAAAANSTQHIVFSIKDNGNELVNVNTTVKGSKATDGVSGSAAIKTGSNTAKVDFYNQDGQFVLKSGNSDTYNVFAESGERQPADDHEQSMNDPELHKGLENIVDVLVGNLKNDVNLSESTGGLRNIDVKLTGSRIPLVANVIGSYIVKEALSGTHEKQNSMHQEWGSDIVGLELDQLDAKLPQLSENVNIDEISLQATIDKNNLITHQIIKFAISGKDASGQAHDVVVSADIDTSDVDNTIPDTVNLAGKKINKIQDMHHND